MRLATLVPVLVALMCVISPLKCSAQDAASRPARAAILDEPGLPVLGQASSRKSCSRSVRRPMSHRELISAEQLADKSVLTSDRFDLLFVPTGRTFPAAARETLIEYLRSGGDLVATGGHAFEDLVRQIDGKWWRERELVEARLDEAMRKEQSLVPRGDFEDGAEIPLGGDLIDSRWHRTGNSSVVATESPWEGTHCASVTLNTSDEQASGGFYAKVPVTPGRTYLASGYVRTRDLTGPGIAYLSVYQLNARGEMVEFRDFAAVRQSADWQRYDYPFTPRGEVTHIRLQAGLYRKNGTASFDDIRLLDLEDARFLPINTSWGEPGDGLKVTPQQIGIFDPSYPLKRAVALKTAGGQAIVDTPVDISQPLQGWAASGVVGNDQARWIPLLETCDRYGRSRGPAGALLLNYGGYYAGSCWAYFGIENFDLFADASGPPAKLLQQTIGFLVRGTFLHNLQTGSALYQAGEPVHVSVQVSNRGRQDQLVDVAFRLQGESAEKSVSVQRQVGRGKSERFEVKLPSPSLSGSMCQVEAVLSCGGKVIDSILSGMVMQRQDVMANGPVLRFQNNYFTLNGRPLFLFGTDTYARTYMSAVENPGTWQQELVAARDMGMNLYENLQYQRPKHEMSDSDWQKFLALAQLTQQQQLVFMPGMLIGHNTAIGPELLSEQSALCRNYAQRMKQVPGLLYYINGDYQQIPTEHAEEITRLWRQWLEERYASMDRLQAAWQPLETPASFGEIPFPPPYAPRWDDVAAIDAVQFKMDLTRRWNRAHVTAVRSEDTEHPITSEYYSQPSDGIDVRLTIDGQDVSNIGYFDEPDVDIDRLPTRIGFADLRMLGQGVSLGEYGVKTHPAWTVANGASHYHIRRSEEQQRQLFMAVAHYGLGLGCSKIQNWCLRDGQTWVFPWGIFYPNQLVPKDVAYVHRNLSILWRAVAPRYEPPQLVVGLASHLRLGSDADVGSQIAYRTFADLLALHVPFGCLDDDHFDKLDSATQVVIYPSPFTLSDAAFDQLRQWVDRGGTLLVTGDLSYDTNRQRTRTQRMTLLAGVKVMGPRYPNIRRDRAEDSQARWNFSDLPAGPVRPCLELAPENADTEVLGRDEHDQAILVRHKVGSGVVYYCSDPLELATDPQTIPLRRQLYRAVATAAGLRPVIADDLPWLHVMSQPTRCGTALVVYNTQSGAGTADVELPTAAGKVRLTTRNRWPGVVVATEEGAVVLTNAYGNVAAASGEICRGSGQQGLLSLDGVDLRRSQAILLAPFEEGHVVLPTRDGTYEAVVGEFVDGSWKTYEVIPLAEDEWNLAIDQDRATSLILICQPDQRVRWEAHLSRMLTRPDLSEGY